MLTPKEREQLRAVLLSERQRLLKNAQESLSFSMQRDRDLVGRDSLDESTEEEMFSTELRLRDREKWLLGKINGALERLDAGNIDECEDCGERIAFRRLVARPVTTLCIDCKEEREKEEQALALRGGPEMPTGGSGADDVAFSPPDD
jgi:DnaK suppressor protein